MKGIFWIVLGIIGLFLVLALISAQYFSEDHSDDAFITTQDSLTNRIIELDTLIFEHTYGPLDSEYKFGKTEPEYNSKWRRTSDSLYTLRRHTQIYLNNLNSLHK